METDNEQIFCDGCDATQDIQVTDDEIPLHLCPACMEAAGERPCEVCKQLRHDHTPDQSTPPKWYCEFCATEVSCEGCGTMKDLVRTDEPVELLCRNCLSVSGYQCCESCRRFITSYIPDMSDVVYICKQCHDE